MDAPKEQNPSRILDGRVTIVDPDKAVGFSRYELPKFMFESWGKIVDQLGENVGEIKTADQAGEIVHISTDGASYFNGGVRLETEEIEGLPEWLRNLLSVGDQAKFSAYWSGNIGLAEGSRIGEPSVFIPRHLNIEARTESPNGNIVTRLLVLTYESDPKAPG